MATTRASALARDSASHRKAVISCISLKLPTRSCSIATGSRRECCPPLPFCSRGLIHNDRHDELLESPPAGRAPRGPRRPRRAGADADRPAVQDGCRHRGAPPPAAAEAASQPTLPPAATSSTAPDLSVDEILRLNAAARGGKEAWRKIKTMVQIGRIERSNEVPGMGARPNRSAALTPDTSKVVELRIEMARPNKMRYELTYQGATAIQAFNGKEGYTVQPGPSGAVARPFSDAQTRASAEQLDLEGPLLDAAAKGTVVTLDGIDSVRDRPAYKLSLKMKSGVVRHVWVDAKTFLDVKLDGTRQIGDRVWPIETLFDDLRKVGSVHVPFQIETTVGGVHTMESVKLVKVMLNAPLEDSLFTLPRAPAHGSGPAGDG